MITKVELTLGFPGRIVLDGVDFSPCIRAVRLEQEAGCLPRVVLDVLVREIAVFGEKPRVEIGDDVQLLLRTLGWTPPAPLIDDGERDDEPMPDDEPC